VLGFLEIYLIYNLRYKLVNLRNTKNNVNAKIEKLQVKFVLSLFTLIYHPWEMIISLCFCNGQNLFGYTSIKQFMISIGKYMKFKKLKRMLKL
jgi:hypothetical protein